MSGGQTGVDRAALDWALRSGIANGGWCPAGRRAEDGVIDPHYLLKETPSRRYEQRTRWNVRDSDGTLILNRGSLEGGTNLTLEIARRLHKPALLVTLDAGCLPSHALNATQWIGENSIHSLNVAGPRENRRPGIYSEALAFLDQLTALMQ
jgi:hypothetical protein